MSRLASTCAPQSNNTAAHKARCRLYLEQACGLPRERPPNPPIPQRELRGRALHPLSPKELTPNPRSLELARVLDRKLAKALTPNLRLQELVRVLDGKLATPLS